VEVGTGYGDDAEEEDLEEELDNNGLLPISLLFAFAIKPPPPD